MSEIQIYYNAPINIINNLKKQELDIDPIVRSGYKTFEEIKGGIKQYGNFCRDEESITINHYYKSVSYILTMYSLPSTTTISLVDTESHPGWIVHFRLFISIGILISSNMV